MFPKASYEEVQQAYMYVANRRREQEEFAAEMQRKLAEDRKNNRHETLPWLVDYLERTGEKLESSWNILLNLPQKMERQLEREFDIDNFKVHRVMLMLKNARRV